MFLHSGDGGDACGLAKSRSKREKREKVGRKTALEQLKKAKMGQKIKYEVWTHHKQHCTLVFMSLIQLYGGTAHYCNLLVL